MIYFCLTHLDLRVPRTFIRLASRSPAAAGRRLVLRHFFFSVLRPVVSARHAGLSRRSEGRRGSLGVGGRRTSSDVG
jgi:hypothetical protein